MTRQNILNDFLENILKESIEIFNESHLKTPLKQTQDKSYEFKNDLFNKETSSKKNDFREFFSRKGLKPKIEKIEDFSLAVDLISGYSNTKIYSKRGLDAINLLHTFIENYVESVNDFKFLESKYKNIFKSFIKFLNTDILQVHYFTPLFRLDFSSKYTQKDLGNIKLTKINKDTFKIIKESIVGTGSVPGTMRRLGYVLESVVPFQNDTDEEDLIAINRFQKFLISAHLFTDGDLKMGSIYKNFTPWMYNSSKILNMSDVTLGPKSSKLNSRSYLELKTFYNKFLDLNLNGKDWSFIQVALDRFSSSILRNNSIEKIVDLNVALECLFSSAGETSLKITNRVSLLYGSDELMQEKCWIFIKNIYKLRNDILHGRKDGALDIAEDIEELEKIVRLSIRKFLNISLNISKKELKSEKKLKSDQNVRDYILNELDLCLINRVRLENFSNISKGLFS
jgi:predicted DNA-binding protein